MRQVVAWLCGRTGGATVCSVAHQAAATTVDQARPFTHPTPADRPTLTIAPRAGDTVGAVATVRYIVDDVDAAIAFYCGQLGLPEVMHPAPTFAMLARGDLRLTLSAPGGPGGGGQAMPDGTVPTPGGWNRFALEVDELEAPRRAAPRGRRPVPQRDRDRRRRQADPRRGPFGNPVELFEPTRPDAREDAIRT